MRWTMLVLAIALGSTAASVRLLDASAQQFSVPDASSDGFPQDDPGAASGAVGPHPMRGWVHGGPTGSGRLGLSQLGLIYDAPDKQLSTADVQKMAEAMLLWHGNHVWRVIGIAADGDRVTFSIATDQNAVVASFAINRHTGALTRLS